MALGQRQKAWINAYTGQVDGVQKFNATAAARYAGYGDPEQSGYANKKNAEIMARVSDILSTHALSPAEVLAELADVAGSEWRDHVTIRTDPRTGETLDVKMDLGSKVKSLEVLAKAHGLLTDRVQHSGEIGVRRYIGVDPEAV